MGLTWLHISDLHIREGESYDRDVVLRALIKAVDNYRKQGRKADLIFVTGDIADSGKENEYRIATQFFDALLEAAKVDKKNLFVIPGNHDVDRSQATPLCRTLTSREDADTYFAPGQKKRHLLDKFEAYRSWFDKYFEGIRLLDPKTTCGPLEMVNVGTFCLEVLPVNTALFALDDHDHGKLWIGRRCLESQIQDLKAQDRQLRIVLVHHPLDWLNDHERANIKFSIRQNFHILLRGHLHETDLETVTTNEGKCLEIAAGASYCTRKWPNRAMFATFDGSNLAVHPIRYEDTPRELWTLDPTVFPHEEGYEGLFPIFPDGHSDDAGSADALNAYRRWLLAKLEGPDAWTARIFQTLGQSDRYTFIPLYGVTTVENDAHSSQALKLLLKNALLERRSLIEGRPGSGKTTFTRLVASELCANSLNPERADGNKIVDPKDRRIPILLSPGDLSNIALKVPFRDISTPDQLVQFLSFLSDRRSWGLSSEDIQTILENGQALMVLDGFEELTLQDQANALPPLLCLFERYFPNLSVLVTVRSQVRQSCFPGFSVWQISDLQEGDVIAFVESLAKDQRSSLLRVVKQELNRDSSIRTLLSLPMTLVSFAVLYFSRQDNLNFHSVVLSSICRWLVDSRKLGCQLTSSHRFNALRAVALAIQFGKEGVDSIRLSGCAEAFTSYPMLQGLDIEGYMQEEAAASGLLDLEADVVRFRLPLFREFFAASALSKLDDDEIYKVFTKVEFAYTSQAKSISGLFGALLEQDAPMRLRRLINKLSDVPSQPVHERVKTVKAIGDLVAQVDHPRWFLQGDVVQNLVDSISELFFSEEGLQEITIGDRVVVGDVIGQCGDKRIAKTRWIKVDGGSFFMGAQASDPKKQNYDPQARPNEHPVHEVTVRSFEVSKYLVTVEEYGAFIEAGGYSSKEFWDSRQFGSHTQPKRWTEQVRFPNRPVVGVSWFEAEAYCRFVGARLPTEEEWEMLACGGGRSFPWGNSAPTTNERCNHGGIIGHTTSVGLFPSGDSPHGVCDLLGNVWEWCSNWAGSYDKPGGSDQALKILRGASWYERPAGSVRPTYRGVNKPEDRYMLLGFRVARTIQ